MLVSVEPGSVTQPAPPVKSNVTRPVIAEATSGGIVTPRAFQSPEDEDGDEYTRTRTYGRAHHFVLELIRCYRAIRHETLLPVWGSI